VKLLSSLFRSRSPRAFALPPDVRAIAVGDVHGRRDLLVRLLNEIDALRTADPRRDDHLVFLGDLIDRGPDSRGVLDLLVARRASDPGLTILAGNHEEMLLAILDGASEHLGEWLRFGGQECIESYGLSAADLMATTPEGAVERLRDAIPEPHVALMREMRDTVALGDYLFVHAGIRPGVAIEDQQAQDLRWIRAPFLTSRADHGVMVVHGHSISEAPEERPNRIGIDTGAYASGRLTALCIDGDARRFLAVSS
jgi:serine/threonine protein phosphatase 1